MIAQEPPSNHLLMYGSENTLLSTRRMILEAQGFVVDTQTSLDDARAQLTKDGGYELLILCRTSSLDDRRILTALANEASIPIYQVGPVIAPSDFIEAISAATHQAASNEI